MLYGYCIRLRDDPPPPPGIAGIDGRPVRLHECGELAVWVSEMEGSVAPSEERLRQHDRVVREALRSATPLPLRFGSVFRSIAALEDAMEAGRDAFRRSLVRVAGLAEMVIRVERRSAGETESGSGPGTSTGDGRPLTGREYLERRRDQLEARESAGREAGNILRELEAQLGEMVVEAALSPVGEGPLVGRVACLVRRGDVPAFKERVAATFETSRPTLAIAVSGPWAPYSFVNE